MKPLKFIGTSLDDLRDFPAEASRQAGFELHAIQRGLEPSDWKPMNGVGPGAREIRIHVLGEWRVLYCGCSLCSPCLSEEDPEDAE